MPDRIVSVDQQRMQHACSTAEGRITYSPGVWKRAVRRVVHQVGGSEIPQSCYWMANDRALAELIGRRATARGFRV